MTAQIIPFRRSIAAPAAAKPGLPALRPVPAPANTYAVDAIRVDAPVAGDSIVGATTALGAACRQMAKNLAVLMAQCTSADELMAQIGDRAATPSARPRKGSGATWPATWAPEARSNSVAWGARHGAVGRGI